MSYFGSELKSVMSSAGMKNSVLAQYVKYDASYISKWISGKAAPSPGIIDRVIEDIIACVSDSLSAEHSISTDTELPDKRADVLRSIGDRLREAYRKDQVSRETPGLWGAASNVAYYPGIPVTGFVREILRELGERRDRELHAILVADFLMLDHESRLLLSNIREGTMLPSCLHPDSSCNMILDLSSVKDCVYDALSLIHLMTAYSPVDFRLYGNPFASGKLLIACDREFTGSAMLGHGDTALAAHRIRNESDSRAMYELLEPFCVQENLLFRRMSMADMLRSQLYLRAMLFAGLRWVVGHITECFVPEQAVLDCLTRMPFAEELLPEAKKALEWQRSLLDTTSVEMVLYVTALSDFIFTGTADLFGGKAVLDIRQRKQVLERFLQLLELPNIEIKLVDSGFFNDFRHAANPHLLLSDSLGYLRMENEEFTDNVRLINHRSVAALLEDFFRRIWSGGLEVVIDDKAEIRNTLLRMRQQLNVLDNLPM